MRKKKILILSEGFGAGHTQAAQALSASLRRMSPAVRTRVLELSSFIHPVLTRSILNIYRKTIVSQPHLFGFLYNYNGSKTLSPIIQLALHRIFYAEAARIIKGLNPDLILCTHPFPSIVISRLKRQGLDVPLCTIITDYDAHGAWVTPEVDRYLVSTTEVKHKLWKLGVELERVQVTGIPVHPNFWEKHNKQELRNHFNLKDMPTVLIMGGGWGIVNNEELLKRIAKWKTSVQLIFCMGNNEKMLQKLSRDPDFCHPNVHVLGFTREIDKLMEVSDLLVTKPGGMTCTEGLAKGIPMLFYDPIPGQEQINCEYFTNHGYGEKLESVMMVDEKLQLLAQQYPEFLRKRHLMSSSFMRYNPQDCSSAILQLLFGKAHHTIVS